MICTRETLAVEFGKIMYDHHRGVLNAFIDEPPTLELAKFVGDLTSSEREEWSSVIKHHEAGSEIMIYRPEWACDIQETIDSAEPR